ncbi:MAG: PAS domain S-box protein, partial [Burkholderiales bacterium]
MISVKRGLFRHPVTLAAGGAALAGLLAANAVAFMRGMEAPWLLGAVILTDMLVVGVSLLAALWSIAVWGGKSDASEARLETIVDSAMDAILTMDAAHRILLFNRAAEQMFGVHRDDALG